ncbi:MAG: S-layer homology domain-containing protein [Candidatus Margulisbacteria bacterium]|nr:S-layer homology domain-containing protein [Candidatus Margulisiibacteriota bacterium]
MAKTKYFVLFASFFFLAAAVISIAYAAADKKTEKSYVEISSPADRSIVYVDNVTLKGKIIDGNVKKLMVQGNEAEIGADGSFAATASLSAGKNSVRIRGVDKNGKLLSPTYVRVLRLVYFGDVPVDYWARSNVEQLATLGILTGYPDGTFRPDASINRAELATILAKLKSPGGQKVEISSFPDVPADYWAEPYIEAAVKAKLVTGYPDETFRPTVPIDRVDAIVVLTRFADLPETYNLTTFYKDILPQHWAVSLISAARAAGFLDYIKGDMFEPARLFTRGETCWVLSRTKYVEAKIKDLMDFEKGYEK